jgi:hypothetical protein
VTNPPLISLTAASTSASPESSGGFTNPPSIDSGGGIFFDFPNPIVVIITDDKMIKNMICGYASAFGMMLLHLVCPW